MAEDEMAGWHHWLNGRESEWTLGVGDGQGALACCYSWGHKELDTTEQLNWTELSDIPAHWAILSSTHTRIEIASCHWDHVRHFLTIPHQHQIFQWEPCMGRHRHLLPHQAQAGVYEETEASPWRDTISPHPTKPFAWTHTSSSLVRRYFDCGSVFWIHDPCPTGSF